MLVRILGPVDVVDDCGGVLAIGSRSQRLVLAALACQRGDAVRADRLADALWGDEPPPTAAQSLRTYVSRLRRLLGDTVTIHPDGYALAAEVDAVRFEGLLAGAASRGGRAALGPLDEALALWRGPAFGDLAEIEILRGAALRLDELRLAAREARVPALTAAGHAAEAVAAGEELVAEHPLREGAWAALVEALAGADRVAEALRAYQRAAEALADAGLEPSQRLRQTEARVLTESAPKLEQRALPVATSSLVGRADDLDALAQLLATSRVVTLTGPGGVGKTRLATELVARVGPAHEWGARLVELSRVLDPAAVAQTVVDGLGLVVDSGSPEAALRRAGTLDVLVVLDNCEHVVDAAARVALLLVSGGERITVLTTSREALGVDGEHIWPVHPLQVGGVGSPAFDLFVRRARAARPDLRVSGDKADAVKRIVARLDGLPLAIEMAAARATTLPLPELAAMLEDRLDILSARRRPGEARHRTLAAVVEWSEDLLDEDDRTLFADLSVFPGLAEVDDIAAVTAHPSPLDALCRLAERSMLVADTSGRRARFGMLAPVRAHAADRVAASGRAGRLARRHAEHILEAAMAADLVLRTPEEAAGHARMAALMDDVRVAYRWSRAHDVAIAIRLCGALYHYAQSRLWGEPLAWAAELVPALTPVDRDPAAAVVFAAAAQWAVNCGSLLEASALAERGAALAVGRPAQVHPLLLLADVHGYEGRLAAAAETGHRALLVARDVGDLAAEVAARTNIALAEAYAGRHVEAEAVLGQDIAWPRLAPSEQGWLSYAEGEVVLDRDPHRALAALDRAVALADSVDNRFLGGVARVSSCSLRARAGDPREALDAFASIIEHWRRQRSLKYQLTTLRNLVVALQRVGLTGEAAELLGSVQAATVAPSYGEEASRLAVARGRITSELGQDEARLRFEAGARRTVDEAAAVALGWLSPMGAARSVGAG